MSTTSADVLGERLAWLRTSVPGVFDGDKLNFERLRELLGDVVDAGPERYLFSWAGRRDAVQVLQLPSRAALIPDPDTSVGFDESTNLFIEGDNLEALKLLYKPYFGRVKTIYIDPPYNTGGDFIYHDNFADPLDSYLATTGQSDSSGNVLISNPETGGRYHSAWLSMMYPRLFLARQLLRDDGIIFVSIDDHEVHNLGMLLNELFGEENFVASLVWEKKKKPSFLHGQLATITESILVYARNRSNVPAFTRGEKEAGKKFPLNNAGNARNIVRFPAGSVKFGLADQTVEPQDMSAGNIITVLLDPVTVTSGTNAEEFRLEGEWRYGQSTIEELLIAGDEFVIAQVPFRPNHVKTGGEPKKASNLLSFRTTGTPTYEDATAEIRALFETDVYDYPKPSGLIRQLIEMADPSRSGVVLDFFAGSCTTADAVMQLNREDGGKRRFIMIQLPELTPEGSAARKAGFDDVAAIGKERMRRAVGRLANEREGELGLAGERQAAEDTGFRTFRLAESSFAAWLGLKEKDPDEYANQMEMFADPLVDGWDPQRVLWEVAVKEGFSLTAQVDVANVNGNRIFRVHDDTRHQSFRVCLDDTLESATLKALDLTHDDLFVCRDSAVDDSVAANLALQCRFKTI